MAAAPALPPLTADQILRRRTTTLEGQWYRLGRIDDFSNDADQANWSAQQQLDFSTVGLPDVPVRANLHHGFTAGTVQPRLGRVPYKRPRPRRLVDPLPEATNVRARQLLTNTSTTAYAAGLRWRHLLGYGGKGIVALYEVQNPHGEVVTCAVKWSLLPPPAGANELHHERRALSVRRLAPPGPLRKGPAVPALTGLARISNVLHTSYRC